MWTFRSSRTADEPQAGAVDVPMDTSRALLSLRNIEKVYETPAGKNYVLRRITLDVQPGEFVTIMGPSGAGKSTLLSILGMLDGAWTGEYGFLHHPIHSLNNKERVAINKQYIGFVFQQYHLLDDLTVAENLDVPLSYRNVKRDERASIVADVLDKFQMVGKKDLYPRQLSGGQQQRAEIARALCMDPQIMLFDEPTAALDPELKHEVGDVLAELAGDRRTIVVATHEPALVRALDGRMVLMDAGAIVGESAAATFLARQSG